ncbi:hypothetical protein PSTG_04222 [Puccinia striiformis f. sp. tritici PST-78]|uniref:PB1 domain-containing protein n=1 Tax=Puccinia striiformis f. sp. tritici PST-78 TaxID=1165861 RepID=A0A0L0VTU2_9BASI|nr:hypothetical protein PSTG_04222 [Puccinia striiformis f. sp. tritici PST-78]
MSSHQAPLSIKIKHATVIHKLQVNQHVPIWSTFSAAIAQRFGMPEEQPIGLQYLDPEGDTITISTQADCDELWHKVLSVTAISSQTVKSAVEKEIIHFWKGLPTADLVGEGKGQYLDLKGAYVLGNPELGHRFLVRSVYEELRKHIDDSIAKSKWVVTGTPGLEKPFFPLTTCGSPHAREKLWCGSLSKLNRMVAYGSPELVNALQKSETLYIVDGQPPLLRCARTLLLTSPQYQNYKDICKQSHSELLYMPPWSYEELQHCKAILYQKLPTTLMDKLFDWYGGVLQYVLARALDEFTESGGNKKVAVGTVLAILKRAIGKGSLTGIIKVHEAEHLDGEYSHRVLHLCRHPSGSLSQPHLALWPEPVTNTYKLQAVHITTHHAVAQPVVMVT